jgi:thiamine-monophosphate kinase
VQTIQLTNSLDEEDIIKIIWRKLATSRKRDPFDDDAAWVLNESRKLVVAKSDMLVSTTDSPNRMTAAQIARKSIVSCVSDFAAKGVRPSFCLVTLGLPKDKVTRSYVNGMATGFASAQRDYSLRIIGGDTNATSVDPVIDCTVIGFSDSVVQRRGAKPGDLIGVSGSFGHQAAGLLILLDKARSRDTLFKKLAIKSVLTPGARLKLGIRASRYLSSCIDSSDGLAISLYHLAESSKAKFVLDTIPISSGLEGFARENDRRSSDLALFGGEEFELVCTFEPKDQETISRMGISTIGKVHHLSQRERPTVVYRGRRIKRAGWVHFKS